MRSFSELIAGEQGDGRDTAPEPAPLGGTRAEAIQRLQIGLAGMGAMVLMIGLANVIMDRANQTDSVVPEAAATTATEPVSAPQNDPLAEAGVVPDLPPEPTAAPTQEPAILPEQGDAPNRRQ